LSTTLSVSLVAVVGVDEAAAVLSVVTLFAMVFVLTLVVGRRYGFTGDAIAVVRPSRQVLVPASFAAERTPPRIHRPHAA
jgi:hypothetical protein